MSKTIVIAGATGNLGGRIVKALLERGATVHAIVRSSSKTEKTEALAQSGAKLIEVDMQDAAALTATCKGADCVVSALAGLHDVIVDAQVQLLHAAVAAGVPHFIPSDFSSDFTKLPPGENRNFDLRREFHEHLDKAAIKSTSIFNGAFAEILHYNIPVLDMKKNMTGYWGDDPSYKLDFTTMDDTAAYTAAAAMDENAPKALHIASFQVSPKELAAIATGITKTIFDVVPMGSLEDFAAHNRRERAAYPEGEQELYPRWQSAQYTLSMFTVQNKQLDNDRYEGLTWEGAEEFIRGMRR